MCHMLTRFTEDLQPDHGKQKGKTNLPVLVTLTVRQDDISKFLNHRFGCCVHEPDRGAVVRAGKAVHFDKPARGRTSAGASEPKPLLQSVSIQFLQNRSSLPLSENAWRPFACSRVIVPTETVTEGVKCLTHESPCAM